MRRQQQLAWLVACLLTSAWMISRATSYVCARKSTRVPVRTVRSSHVFVLHHCESIRKSSVWMHHSRRRFGPTKDVEVYVLPVFVSCAGAGFPFAHPTRPAPPQALFHPLSSLASPAHTFSHKRQLAFLAPFFQFLVSDPLHRLSLPYRSACWSRSHTIYLIDLFEHSFRVVLLSQQARLFYCAKRQALNKVTRHATSVTRP